MKFIDCFMYFNEDMILDIRLNILDKYVETQINLTIKKGKIKSFKHLIDSKVSLST